MDANRGGERNRQISHPMGYLPAAMLSKQDLFSPHQDSASKIFAEITPKPKGSDGAGSGEIGTGSEAVEAGV